MKPDRAGRQAAERRGRWAETAAAWYLRAKGYRIRARRFKTPRGEIDIVAQRGSVLAIVEVKARATAGSAVAAVTRYSRSRLIDAAGLFCAQNPELAGLSLRFDVIAVTPFGWPRHIRQAFGHEPRLQK